MQFKTTDLKNSKFQTPSSRETPSSKSQGGGAIRAFWNLNIGASLEFGVWSLEFFAVAALLLTCSVLALALTGCGGGAPTKQNRDFFTSGSREADQRASQ